jgi:hypothetical protein
MVRCITEESMEKIWGDYAYSEPQLKCSVVEKCKMTVGLVLCICHHRPLQLRCYCTTLHQLLMCHHPSTCRLVVTLDWLSLRHFHADGVVVSHLFPAVDISVTALSVAAAIVLGAVVL